MRSGRAGTRGTDSTRVAPTIGMRLDRLRIGAALEPGPAADALVRPVCARAEALRERALEVRLAARTLAARSRSLRTQARAARGREPSQDAPRA